MARRAICADCHRERSIEARGKCGACNRAGDSPIVDFQTAEHEHLVSELLWIGLDPERPLDPQFEIYAHRFDMSPRALAKAWYRAQAVAA